MNMIRMVIGGSLIFGAMLIGFLLAVVALILRTPFEPNAPDPNTILIAAEVFGFIILVWGIVSKKPDYEHY